ncbi:Hpt domain-containing protein [Paucibacter sp. APW11]|uniref:Hpt domain-containing protein n=1 Tax=Roseateles aquae TaxID=3077235 RepID=A0ABU3PDT4_9BURK|nr:Hpt domain-containing protein [Paucibacter sp. APW11]MDT9000046.1 Hpt domain-containing protein [Paucibacter sp. APW11]
MSTWQLLLLETGPAPGPCAAALPACLPPDAELLPASDSAAMAALLDAPSTGDFDLLLLDVHGAQQLMTHGPALPADAPVLVLGEAGPACPWPQTPLATAALRIALLQRWRDWMRAKAAPLDGPAPALELNFGGNRAFFETFYLGCRPQFALDLQQGDQALATGDSEALMHLAHGLKGVLLILGESLTAVTARELEHCARERWVDQLAPLWAELRGAIAALAVRPLGL